MAVNLYVSSHDVLAARLVAAELEAAGHLVLSSWHDKARPCGRTDDVSGHDRTDKAFRNVKLVREADAVVLVARPDRVPGGKFVEAGAALGPNKPVHVVGPRQNLLLWHPLVRQHDDVRDLLAALAEAA